MWLLDAHSPIHNTPGVDSNPCPKKLGELTRAEMHELIDRLKPRHQMLAGIVLLHRVLDATYDDVSKTKGFLEFFEKAQKILGESGKLLRYDFEPQIGESVSDPYVLGHADALRKLPMTRRSLFKHTAYAGLSATEAALALAFAAYGAAKTEQALHQKESAPPMPAPKKQLGERVIESMDKTWWGPLDVLIGVTFGAGAGITASKIFENREEEIFEQISNAIAEFNQSLFRSALVNRPRHSATR